VSIYHQTTINNLIIIADDDLDLVRSTVEFLRREFPLMLVVGFSVSREAAALIARQRPSLLVSNVSMPAVGGLDLCVLAQKRWGYVPTLSIIDNSDETSDGDSPAAAQKFHIKKPFHAEDLLILISSICDFSSNSLSSRLLDSEQVSPDAPFVRSNEDTQWALRTERNMIVPPNEPSENLVSELATEQLEAEQQSDGEGAAGRTLESYDTLVLNAGRADLQTDSGQALDFILDTETPLPPNSQSLIVSPENNRTQDGGEEVSDEEVEINDQGHGHSSLSIIKYQQERAISMALTSSNIKENLAKLEAIEGFIGAALADSDSGMCLGFLGGAGVVNLEVAAAANTEVVRSKRKAIKALNLRDEIEDILITLGKQYHLIRPVRSRANLFYYLVLDRQRANLAMARFNLADTERELPM